MTFTEAVSRIKELATDEIVEIISERISLKKSGSYYKSCCPFHDEKSPSFYVSEVKGTYKCYGCGQWGDAIDFISKYDGFTFKEVIYLLADRYHLSISKKSRQKYQNAYKKADEIIPGFSSIKAEISKAKKVYAVFNTAHTPFTPSISIDGSLSQEAANLLKKRTDTIVFSVESPQWKQLRRSIYVALSSGLDVFIVPINSNEPQEMDWMDYCLSKLESGVERKDVIKLVAAIPDNITRSCYVTYFTQNFKEITQL
ncbi:MAG: CHC2 zinc finger domain-containing protein [Gracilimonas sp.]